MRQVHLVAGLPRSGSTLLMQLLAQHPDAWVTETSGLPGVLRAINEHWWANPAHQAISEQRAIDRLTETLYGAIEGYHHEAAERTVFDKSRAWPQMMEIVDSVLGKRVKLIACVREPVEILASLEQRWRATRAVANQGGPPEVRQQMLTQQGRLALWVSDSQVFGAAFNSLGDACHRGYRDRILFVPMETLTEYPGETMRQVWEWVGMEPAVHDFEKIEQVTHEDDLLAHGFLDLHKIKPSIRRVREKAEQVLGAELIKKYRESIQCYWEKEGYHGIQAP